MSNKVPLADRDVVKWLVALTALEAHPDFADEAKMLRDNPNLLDEYLHLCKLCGIDVLSLDPWTRYFDNESAQKSNVIPLMPKRIKSSEIPNDPPNFRKAVGFNTSPDDASHPPRWEAHYQYGGDTICLMAQPDSRRSDVVQIVIWVDHPKELAPGRQAILTAVSSAGLKEESLVLRRKNDRIQARRSLRISWSEFLDAVDWLDLTIPPSAEI